MEARAYIGWETPVARGGRGATGPPPPARDLFANSKINYIEVMSPVAWATGPLSPLGRATGGQFRNFSKQTYIFEFFLNIKKKKTPAQGVSGPGRCWIGNQGSSPKLLLGAAEAALPFHAQPKVVGRPCRGRREQAHARPAASTRSRPAPSLVCVWVGAALFSTLLTLILTCFGQPFK